MHGCHVTRKALVVSPIGPTVNVYTQVLGGSLRATVDKIGTELFSHRRESAR